MPISIEELRKAATRPNTEGVRSLSEARARGRHTAFLCHSHADSELVKGLVNLLGESGWSVYVDWQDATMPAVPDRTTAQRIKSKIVETDYFLFLATPSSTKSRWCPWEIGYADGKKHIDRILIIPTTDQDGRHYGSEYLQLYRQVDTASSGGLGAWNPGQRDGTLLRQL